MACCQMDACTIMLQRSAYSSLDNEENGYKCSDQNDGYDQERNIEPVL